jgi:uncharacterized protein
VEIDFKKLIELQELDDKIRDVSLFLDNLPSRIQEIDRRIETSIEIVNRAKEKLSQNQKRRRQLEADVQDNKIQIEKYRRQLGGVKTNKEYSTLLKEIENSTHLIEEKEELILEEMLTADEIENEIRSAEKEAEEIKTNLLKQKAELEKTGKMKEEERRDFSGQKDEMIPAIPKDQIKPYKTIFKKMGGIALSPVTDDFCSMCQIRIRPQVLNELIAGNTVILCENCGRILYWVQK